MTAKKPAVPDKLRIEVHLTPEDLRAALKSDVIEGLSDRPRALPPKWFYDERGSQLFEQITALPEYYLTGREREILTRQAGHIAEATKADTLIELGSGYSEKTRLLLDSMRDDGHLVRYVAFDVSEAALRDAGQSIASDYPGLDTLGIVGDFDHHLDLLPTGGRRLVAFLGSTIGNLSPAHRENFLSELTSGLAAGDWLLLGTDLVKDVARLEAAYNDALGVTADFNLNMLRVLNRELNGDFDIEAFEHVARWDPQNMWIEMCIRSLKRQQVTLDDLGLTIDFALGEETHTEISTKFSRTIVEAELAAAGLRLVEWWTDTDGDFALSLATAG